jgi:hypothetical protein
MNYQEMYNLIVDNHSEHWGGSFEAMLASDAKLVVAKSSYPELYAKAQADFNNKLANL